MGLMGYSPLGHKELGMTKHAHMHTHIIILLKKNTSLRMVKPFVWATQLEKGPHRNSDSASGLASQASLLSCSHRSPLCAHCAGLGFFYCNVILTVI